MVQVNYIFIKDILTAKFTDGKNSTLPNITGSLYTFVYGGYTDIKNIIIDNTFTEIDSTSLLNAVKLESIDISHTITTISDTAFDTTRKLTQINVDNKNPVYSSSDGVLFSSGPTLYRYPLNKSNETYDIPETIKYIANNAFKNTDNLMYINIPATVSSIGTNVFLNTYKLKSITVNNSNSTYISIDGVLFINNTRTLIRYPPNNTESSYIIPNDVEGIDRYAFSNTFNLNNIIIGENITSIDITSFQNAYSLNSIIVDDANSRFFSEDGILFTKDKNTILYYPRNNSKKSYTIPSSVKKINENAFAYVSNLLTVDISNNVTIIGNNAFSYSPNITTITIPASVTSISENAFQNLTQLTQYIVNPNNLFYSSDNFGVLFRNDSNGKKTILVQYPIGNTNTNYSIPNTITKISNFAFINTNYLTTIYIPASVNLLGDNLNYSQFYLTKNLTSIIVDTNNKKFYSDEFGVLFSKDKTILLQYPSQNKKKNYIIPNTVKIINNYAFYNANYLTTIFIPDSVTTIGQNVFQLATNLSAINIPSSITTIQPGAFLYTSALNVVYIEIPNRLNLIESKNILSYGLGNVTFKIKPASFSAEMFSSNKKYLFILYIIIGIITLISIITIIILIIKKNKNRTGSLPKTPRLPKTQTKK